MEAFRWLDSAHNHKNEPVQAVARLQYALTYAFDITCGRVWNTLGMSVPVADEVEPQAKAIFDLDPLRRSIGQIRGPCSEVADSRPCRLFHKDSGSLDSCKQLSTRFAVPETQLAVELEVIEHRIAEHKNLFGFSNGILDHAATA
jgi:hypothetical protein